MGWEIIGLITLLLLLFFLFSGFAVGISLILISLIGVSLTIGDFGTAINILGSTAYGALRSYSFAVIPLFVLMGLFASEAGSGRELYDSANILLKKLRGGLAMATILANAVFAAITGASIASAAIFTKISYPEMVRYGYKRNFAVGTVAGSSVLGMLIPPSILMIVYGGVTNVSIGKLFLGGIVPGIILSIIFCITVAILCKVKNVDEYNLKEEAISEIENDEKKWKIIIKPIGFVVLIIILFSGMWGGIFTPTEAGGVGAFMALVFLIIKRKFTWTILWNCLLETGKTSGSILFLILSANMFSRMLSLSGVVANIGTLINQLDVPNIVIVIIFCLLQIALGCILDSTSIILMTVPIAVPVITSLGFDPVWYGVILVVAVEVGLITPPFGISVFTVKATLDSMQGLKEDVPVQEIFVGSMPYLVGMIILLILMMIFPNIVLFLPNSMI